MRIFHAALVLVLCLFASQSQARTVIINCVSGDTPAKRYEESAAIVVATVLSISVKDVGKQFQRRTILWHVNESWTGPHYKGSRFTTREHFYTTTSSWSLQPGRSMLLYLRGHEPYELESPGCGTSGYLEDSIPRLNELFQLRRDWDDEA
jgi:hypothetical protein